MHICLSAVCSYLLSGAEVVGIKDCHLEKHSGADQSPTFSHLVSDDKSANQVWAVKSYTKSVPVYVQVLQRDSLRMLAPFLDPEQDVLVSVEQMRHRLLALSCLCPGASTLIGAHLPCMVLTVSTKYGCMVPGWQCCQCSSLILGIWHQEVSNVPEPRNFIGAHQGGVCNLALLSASEAM